MDIANKTVLFIGDSITDDGRYVYALDCALSLAGISPGAIYNAGVSAETVCGLTEYGRPQPRPCVFGRLSRVLEATRPDIVFCCYGMNDGLFSPPDSDRQELYARGLKRLCEQIRAFGASVVLLTPTIFSKPGVTGAEHYNFAAPYALYDEVLARHAAIVLDNAQRWGAVAIDIRTPLLRAAAQGTVLRDGVHPDLVGHFVIASAILKAAFNISVPSLYELLSGSDIFRKTCEKDSLEHALLIESVGHDFPTKRRMPSDDELSDARRAFAAADRHITELHGVWHGFESRTGLLNGREYVVVLPRKHASNRPWVWRTEFFGAFAQADQDMLRRGWAVAHYRLPDMYGAPQAIRLMEDFHCFICDGYGFSKKASLFGFSRGGLYALHFACAHPQWTHSLYLDAPVVDVYSWPRNLPALWAQCSAAWGIPDTDFGKIQRDAVDRCSRDIPLALVAGDADTDVPFERNGALLMRAWERTGTPLYVNIKKGCAHHPHSLPDPTEITEFICAQGVNAQ